MNYHNVTKCDMLNGEGARVVLWVSGCTHACPNCHNRQTWDKNSGIPFTSDVVDEILQALSEPFCNGLTLSGGDPLATYNYETVLDLCKLVKKQFPTKTIWIYTGYVLDEVKVKYPEILEYIDVLVDGPYIERLRDKKLQYRGSSNQNIIRLT